MNNFTKTLTMGKYIILLLLAFIMSCASPSTNVYHDPDMDFSSIKTIAVMPFTNLTRDKLAAERVKDIFSNSLLSTGAAYVIPPGEVAWILLKNGVINPSAPAGEEIAKLADTMKADAIITGVVNEYGEIRSGTISTNIISISMQMIESQSQKVIWTASSTKGRIDAFDRLFGGGGKPMNDVTQMAVNDIISQLFKKN